MSAPAFQLNSNDDLASIITPWKQPAQTTYVFKNANVIDPQDGSIARNVTVRLAGGFVESLHVKGEALDEDGEAETIDLEGKYILPGLWDCHVHLVAVQGSHSLDEILDYPPTTVSLRQPEIGQAMLDRGFTTVRDCGGALLPLKQAFAEGIHPGPRLFIAGRQLTQSGGSGDHRAQTDDRICCAGAVQTPCRTVDGVPECLKFAREEIRLGADFIKIMAGGAVSSPLGKLTDIDFTEEEIQAITIVTRNAGTFTTAHAYTPAVIQHAIRCGVLGIEHGNFLDQATAEMMAEKGVFYTPTLTAYAAGQMPEFGSFVSEASRLKLKSTLESGIEAIKIAKAAGVKMCFGTDLLGPMHFAQTKEFVIRRAAQTPLEIIQSATVNAAQMMGRQDSLGRVAPGFVADLLILNANPLDDIAVLDRPDEHLLAVFKEGRLMTSRWSRLTCTDSPGPVAIRADKITRICGREATPGFSLDIIEIGRLVPPSQSSEERRLFHHFVTSTSGTMVPVQGLHKPWKSIYPLVASQATSSSSVRSLYHALLTQAAYHLINLIGEDNATKEKARAGHHYGCALRELRKTLQTTVVYEQAFAALLAIPLAEHVFRGDANGWDVHYTAAIEFVCQHAPSRPWKKSVEAWTVSQSFALEFLILQTSRSPSSPRMPSSVHSVLDQLLNEPGFGWTHGGTGHIFRLIYQIRRLEEDLYQKHPHGFSGVMDTATQAQVDSIIHQLEMPIEDQLNIYVEHQESFGIEVSDHMRQSIHLHLRLFTLGVEMYLLCTVLRCPPMSVREKVDEALSATVDYVDLQQQGSFSIWPVFIAATQAYTAEAQALATYCLQTAESTGAANRRDVHRLVRQVWLERERLAETLRCDARALFVDWRQVMKDLGLNVLLL
ncbi:hypothetical protein PRZ48_011011 [Zasmidium cellare]|uniref:Amidohydrolase-related domain-containing protein n=1 Tax=Zasmidium cellare TaxID=395010 RepID=A0ABR0EBC8_ZASCE|nr:hypothetical protein PRZ48_011011 [Zasmidium cellare]